MKRRSFLALVAMLLPAVPAMADTPAAAKHRPKKQRLTVHGAVDPEHAARLKALEREFPDLQVDFAADEPAPKPPPAPVKKDLKI